MTGGLIDKGKHRAAMGANDINQYLLDLATFRGHLTDSSTGCKSTDRK